jgi:mRNA interferase MazF
MKGKIVLIPFPFSNLTTFKRRPALVLLERKNDVVVAFISSKIPVTLEKYTMLIDITHKDFKQTGLKVSSIIYLDKIATIDKKLTKGELGEIGKGLKKKINKNFKKLYKL